MSGIEPKAESPYKNSSDWKAQFADVVWAEACEAQSRLLAEQGWVKLPSEADLGWQITLALEDYNEAGPEDESLSEYICHWLHRWLMEVKE